MTTAPTLRFMERTDPGFARAFGVLARRFGDPVCAHRESGEVWQYMGSVETPDGWVHEFRHRHLPVTGQRTFYQVPAQADDFGAPS